MRPSIGASAGAMPTIPHSCCREPVTVVRGVGRGIGVLDGGPRRARRRGGFGYFCSPIFTAGIPIA